MGVLLDSKIKIELTKVLLENTPIGYAVLDKDYRIHYMNDSMIKLRKFQDLSVIGSYCYELSNRTKPCDICAVRGCFVTGRKTMLRRCDTFEDGVVKYVDDYAIPLWMDQDGNVEFVLEMMVDCTQEAMMHLDEYNSYIKIVTQLTDLLESKDTYTATHSHNVQQWAVRLAQAMKLSSEEIFEISLAASLHDIGKIAIPKKIINKPEKLTDEEFALIKSHPVASYNMIQGVSNFEKIKNIVRHHHEHIDGRGYPDGLKEEEIPLGAKIIAVADTYDAITSTRSYRQALSHEYALSEIQRVAGTQLDKKIVDIFVKMSFNKDMKPIPINGYLMQSAIVDRFIDAKTDEKKQVDVKPKATTIGMDQLFLKIMENSPCGYLLLDRQLNILFASEYYAKMFKIRTEELIGMKCYEIGSLESKICPECQVENILKGGKACKLRRELVHNGVYGVFDVFVMGVKKPDKSGEEKVRKIISIMMNRTKEVKLRQSRKQDLYELLSVFDDIYKKESEEIDTQLILSKIQSLKKELEAF